MIKEAMMDMNLDELQNHSWNKTITSQQTKLHLVTSILYNLSYIKYTIPTITLIPFTQNKVVQKHN